MPDYMDIEQQIANLTAHLTSDTSDVGDWKIAKYQEYLLTGQEPPYDIQELHTKRQMIRDQINDLRKQLESVDVE